MIRGVTIAREKKKVIMKSMWLQPSSIIKITFRTIHIVFVLSTVRLISLHFRSICTVYYTRHHTQLNDKILRMLNNEQTNNTWQQLKYLYAYNDSTRLTTIVLYLFLRSICHSVLVSFFERMSHCINWMQYSILSFFAKFSRREEFHFSLKHLTDRNDKNGSFCKFE